ncbi:MAG: AMP-binding protein [Bacteroidales bacterium]|nr:AMP-binding protein [Bacteroidales bacterium]
MRHNFQSLADVFNYTAVKYAKRTAFCSVDGDCSYTFASFSDSCRRQSRMLSNFGISAGDKVAILSQNMPNWPVAFFAITAFGRIAVPMLTELTENEITNILVHSEAKALYVSRRLYPKVPEELLAKMHIVIATDDLSILRVDGTAYTCDGHPSNPIADDLACIIYTSGTTGAAKGVMLTHKNFCANIYASWKAAPAHRRDVFLSILPLAHTYEMSVGMLYPFSVGAKIYYLSKAPTPSVLMPAFKKLRPTMMLSVPLVIEKIYKSSIIPTIRKSRFLTWLDKTSHSLLCLLVGMRLKKTFGGRLHFFGIGGAKLDQEVEAFLAKAKFPYAIGYGLTETAPLICNANPKQTHLGTTGIATTGVQIRLDNLNPTTGEGEIVVKGDNVMMGYYKDFERTQQVLSADGWLRTGDLASVDKKGRYSIKGRLGSVILGPSGENIYPEEIENVINNINGINESLVVERDGHLVALVHFDDNVLDWNYENQDRFIEDIERRKQEILEFVNTHVNRNSRIKEVQVEKKPFDKTATLKIKRFLYKEKKKPTTDGTDKE